MSIALETVIKSLTFEKQRTMEIDIVFAKRNFSIVFGMIFMFY